MDENDVEALLEEANKIGVKLRAADGQLQYRVVDGSITEEFREKLRTRSREIVDALSGPAFLCRERPATVPILEFYHDFLHDIQSGVHGVSLTNGTYMLLRYEGCLNVAALRASVDSLVSRHCILSARVIDTSGGPEFIFDQQRNVSLNIEDLSTCEIGDKESIASRRASELVWTPFDIGAGPLFRVFAIKVTAAVHLVGFVVHHFICDLPSVNVVANELLQGYGGNLIQSAPHLVSTPLQYPDYVMAMNEWMRGANAKLRLAYWKRQLNSAPCARIPPDFDNRGDEIGEVNLEPFQLGPEVLGGLQKVSKSRRVTLFEVLLAAKIGILSYILKSPDVVVLTMFAGRGDPRLHNMVGATMNRLALRTSVSMDMRFVDLVDLVHEICTAAYENQVPYLMLEPILQQIGASREFPLINFAEPSVLPSTAAALVRKWKPMSAQPPTITATASRHPNHWMRVTRSSSHIFGSMGYSSLWYKPATIRRFLDQLSRLLAGAACRPGGRLLSLIEE
jgi:hypothetical protein